jgi:hypothetical protein
MPYAIHFVKPVAIADRKHYINACCIGGDIVLGQLFPCVAECYCNVQSNQEDWGWFIWFEESGVKLAIDISTDNDVEGRFQVHLTSRKQRFLLPATIVDTPELESLRELVVANLKSWNVADLEVERVDEKYLPI